MFTAKISERHRSDAPRDPASPSSIDLLDLHRTSRIEAGLSACFEAFTYAEDLGCDSWDFAVECATLRKLGLSRSDLRWLVGKGLLSCAIENTLPGDSLRTFERSLRPLFDKKSCFALTSQGVEFSRRLYGGGCGRNQSHSVVDLPLSRSMPHDATLQMPQWDRDRQLLRIGPVVVKQFKVPATNQETVLAAFEEEAWPPRIDDPLPPHRQQSPKRRLQETIKSLNRNHKQLLIRFVGDGRGTGVRWEFRGNIELPCEA